MEEIFFSVNHVALMIKVHPLTVRRYIREGKLKALKMGGSIRIAQSSLDEFARQTSTLTPSPKKFTKTNHDKVFSLDDPIFRLKSAGVHLKQFE